MTDGNYLETRRERVRSMMREHGIDALWLNYGANFQYVTGIEEPDTYIVGRQYGDWVTGLLFPTEGDPKLIIRPNWVREHVDNMPFEVIAMEGDGDADEWLGEAVRAQGLDGKTIGVPKMLWAETLLSLQRGLPTATFVPLGDVLIDKVREIKQPDEIAILEECGRITDAAFADIIKALKPGMLDRDLVLEIDYQLKKHGGDGFSFMPTAVLDGHGARYAKHWNDRREPQPITHGTSVAFDLGVRYKGYTSDFGRSAFIGQPADEPRRAWRSITKAIQAAMGVMGAGRITPAGIHDFVVESVTEDGFREQFSWYALGHCVGLDVHENPWMLPAFTEPIQANMVFALEPKIGRPGSFYVRCEDIVVVEDGAARPLTRYPYDEIVIE